MRRERDRPPERQRAPIARDIAVPTRLPGSGRVEFYRRRDGGDNWRRYKIEIDGEPVGVLKPGSTLSVEVPAGTRVCRARIDWTGSEETAIPITADGTTRVYVRKRPDLTGLESARWLVLLIDDDAD